MSKDEFLSSLLGAEICLDLTWPWSTPLPLLPPPLSRTYLLFSTLPHTSPFPHPALLLSLLPPTFPPLLPLILSVTFYLWNEVLIIWFLQQKYQLYLFRFLPKFFLLMVSTWNSLCFTRRKENKKSLVTFSEDLRKLKLKIW